MRKGIIFLCLWGMAQLSFAQKLTLDSCVERAWQHYQYAEQEEETQASGRLAIQNTQMAWLPSFTLQATSTIQNEQMGLEGPNVPGFSFPDVPLDFHRVLINFSQTIYDGGMVSTQKQLQHLQTEEAQTQVEAQKLGLRASVTSQFMGIMLAQKQVSLLHLKMKTLQEQMGKLQQAVTNGVATEADLQNLQAELITTRQDSTEIRYTETEYLQKLTDMMGMSGTLQASQLLAPESAPLSTDISLEGRPDIHQLALKQQQLTVQKQLSKNTRLPKIQLFGNAGYGDPGYNVFKSGWRPMLLAGIRLEWKIYDWKDHQNKVEMLSYQSSSLQKEQDRLKWKWNMELEAKQKEVAKMNKLMEQDDELITLRENITRTKSHQLAQGTITSAEYITALNQEHAARLAKAVHALKQIISVENYQIILGK